MGCGPWRGVVVVDAVVVGKLNSIGWISLTRQTVGNWTLLFQLKVNLLFISGFNTFMRGSIQ